MTYKTVDVELPERNQNKDRFRNFWAVVDISLLLLLVSMLYYTFFGGGLE